MVPDDDMVIFLVGGDRRRDDTRTMAVRDASYTTLEMLDMIL